MLTDSHCHLDQLDDPTAAVEAARGAGVGRIVAVSEALDSIDRVLALADAYPGTVLPGVGIHPVEVLRMTPEDLEAGIARVRDQIDKATVVGEVGLDFKHADDDEKQTLQRNVLRRFFDLAALAGKPVNLHSRYAHRQTLEAAIEFAGRTGLGAQMHWFTKSKKLVRLANEAPHVYVSVGPTVLDDPETAAVVAEIDRRRLLLETDAPVRIRDADNSPARAAEVAAAVADIWQAPVGLVEARTEENFQRYLGEA